MRVLSQAVFVTLLVIAHSAIAQEPCGQALSHLDGCRGLCDLPDIGTEYCNGIISDLSAALTTSCDSDTATLTLQSSCAGLVRGSDGPGSGNVCVRAGEHFVACIEQDCVRYPDSALCPAIPDIRQSLEEYQQCDEIDAEEARELLSQSCDELLGMFR